MKEETPKLNVVMLKRQVLIKDTGAFDLVFWASSQETAWPETLRDHTRNKSLPIVLFLHSKLSGSSAAPQTPDSPPPLRIHSIMHWVVLHKSNQIGPGIKQRLEEKPRNTFYLRARTKISIPEGETWEKVTKRCRCYHSCLNSELQ